jgi:hypothetical protein
LGIRVNAQRSPNFPYRGFNAGVAIRENPRSPNPLHGLVARDQLTASFGQLEEQIERDALQVHDPATTAELGGASVELEICEAQHPRRQLHRLHEGHELFGSPSPKRVRLRTVARAAALPVPAHLCHIASFQGVESALRGHQMGHSTVAMVVRHYARWTHKPDGGGAERVERFLAAGLFPPKMPEICQKAVDSNPFNGHSDRAQAGGIASKIGNGERWPSGRRHQIANLASWVTGTEGSNPSLSAKFNAFAVSLYHRV